MFGNSSSCTHNYFMHSFLRGIYNATCTASNDFYQKSIKTQIIACPNAKLNVTYNPGIYSGGIGIIYLGKMLVNYWKLFSLDNHVIIVMLILVYWYGN